MALPNNAIYGCVRGGRNEKAGNDFFDHLASHIWICAAFITIAGLSPFLHRHHSEVKWFLLSQPNVSAEVPLFLFFPSHRRWPFMLSWPRQCSMKKGVCLCVCVFLNESTIHIPLSLSCSGADSHPRAGMDVSHAAPRWTLKRQQRAKMGRLAPFCPSAFFIPQMSADNFLCDCEWLLYYCGKRGMYRGMQGELMTHKNYFCIDCVRPQGLECLLAYLVIT